MTQPLLLYSTATRLAYSVAQRYFGELHYVWCAPRDDPDPHAFHNPPSSNPILLYRTYERDIAGGDEHSAVIAANRRGIIRGAVAKEAQGMIDRPTRELIEAVAKQAPLPDFKPLLFVIPYAKVANRVKPAGIDDRARPMAQEFIIEELPRSSFDVLDLSR
jgi:hypothetical protein